MIKDRYSVEEFKKLIGVRRLLKDVLNTPLKYRNSKVIWTGVFRGRVQNIKFDSKKEMSRFIELKNDPSCCDSLQLQEKFLISPASETEKALYYVSDFYYLKDGKWTIEDTKGFKTRVYINKRKLVKDKYPDILFIES